MVLGLKESFSSFSESSHAEAADFKGIAASVERSYAEESPPNNNSDSEPSDADT